MCLAKLHDSFQWQSLAIKLRELPHFTVPACLIQARNLDRLRHVQVTSLHRVSPSPFSPFSHVAVHLAQHSWGTRCHSHFNMPFAFHFFTAALSILHHAKGGIVLMFLAPGWKGTEGGGAPAAPCSTNMPQVSLGPDVTQNSRLGHRNSRRRPMEFPSQRQSVAKHAN